MLSSSLKSIIRNNQLVNRKISHEIHVVVKHWLVDYEDIISLNVGMVVIIIKCSTYI